MRKISFTILGKLASMKNTRSPSRHNPYVTHKQPSARAFEREFMRQVPRAAQLALGSLKRPLKATVRVWYPDYRSDVDAELVFDLCQKAGVIRNDRYIRWKDVQGLDVDKENPRVEITIEEIA